MKKTFLMILCTAPDMESAEKISTALVAEKLAACCNIVPGLKSIYSWKGEIQKDAEYLIIIKTTRSVYEELEKRIVSLHPYEVPEVIALPVELGNMNYLNWIGQNVG